MASPNRWGLALLVLVGSFSAYAAAPRPAESEGPVPPSICASRAMSPRPGGTRPATFTWSSSAETGNKQRLLLRARWFESGSVRWPSRRKKPASIPAARWARSSRSCPAAGSSPSTRSRPRASDNSRLVAQRSTDGGATWSGPLPVERRRPVGPRTASPRPPSISTGELIVSWLDRRSGQQGVTFSRSRDGLRFAANRTVGSADLPVLRHERGGWRHRESSDRVPRTLRRGRRDIAVASWRPAGGPHGGRNRFPRRLARQRLPRLGTADGPRRGRDTLVAWFTGAGPGVFVSRSKDGGKTFTPRVPIAPLPGEKRPCEPSGHRRPARREDPRRLRIAIHDLRTDPRERPRDLERTDQALPTSPHARISVGAGRSALSFTARDGNDTVAAASSQRRWLPCMVPPGAPSLGPWPPGREVRRRVSSSQGNSGPPSCSSSPRRAPPGNRPRRPQPFPDGSRIPRAAFSRAPRPGSPTPAPTS